MLEAFVKTVEELTPSQKEKLLVNLTKSILLREISPGELLRRLRVSYLGMNQDDYAELIGISRRSLHAIETDEKPMSSTTLLKAFSPLGFTLGLVPQSPEILESAIGQMVSDAIRADGSIL